jgi:hypothetical protein
MLMMAQRRTRVTVIDLFVPLPVRRKELEHHAKREFTKALNLLTVYALVPCTRENNGMVLPRQHPLFDVPNSITLGFDVLRIGKAFFQFWTGHLFPRHDAS